MDKKEFLTQLKATAAELKPLTDSATSGGLAWNGTEYVKNSDSKHPDPYALAWWFTLDAIAELLECQESPLTVKQVAYLKKMLFGGMGSLTGC
jgi:hypothetical protein